MATPSATRTRGPAIHWSVIPGFMQSAADYREAGYVERLAASRRVLILDPLGHGRSDRPHDPEAYRAPDVAADVIAVLDAAGLDRAALWGYSRGGWLACMTAIECSQRLNVLILGGAALTGPPPAEMPAWVDHMSRGDWDGFWRLFPIPLATEVMRHFEEANDPRALAAERIGRIGSAYAFDLARVSVPALVYCGGDDELGEAVPTARELHTELRVVEGCDHYGGFKAIDRVAPLVVDFLETAPVSRGGQR